MTDEKPKLRRGFACLSPERRLEISRLGGASVPADKRSFSAQKGLAAAAGTKGGATSRRGPKKAPDAS